MNHRVSSIKNLRTVKALRGEALTIDLGKPYIGIMKAWMKKNPNDNTYRSFEIRENRYLILSKTKASDYYNEDGDLLEAIEGKWKFDVELIKEGKSEKESKTIFTGTILFENDITGSIGVEITERKQISKIEIFPYEDLPVGNIGDIALINNASNISYRSPALGGGSNLALVTYDGSQWIYH